MTGAGASREAWIILLFTLVVNVPFGWWRAGTRKLSPAWFVAVHAPVALIAALRIGIGLGWRWGLLPFTVAAYCTGQFVGGRLRRGAARPGGA